MKNVTYMGQVFKGVPTKAKWVAADDNGVVYAYRQEPEYDSDAECYLSGHSLGVIGTLLNKYPCEAI